MRLSEEELVSSNWIRALFPHSSIDRVLRIFRKIKIDAERLPTKINFWTIGLRLFSLIGQRAERIHDQIKWFFKPAAEIENVASDFSLRLKSQKFNNIASNSLSDLEDTSHKRSNA